MRYKPPGYSAVFSSDRRWRYELRRVTDPARPLAMFVGLNPSTADEVNNDPTVGRCIRFARDWGYGGLLMTNLFAYRATDPAELRRVEDPVGPDNDEALQRCAGEAGIVIAAWGNHGAYLRRARHVLDAGLLGHYTVLGLNKTGYPRHPLYLRADSRPFDPPR